MNKRIQYIRDIYYAWNQKGMIKHRKLTPRIKRAISGALRDYEDDKEIILIAINNYATVLLSDEYWWTYRWTLAEFLQRGLDKFADEQSLNNHRKAKKNDTPKIPDVPSDERRREMLKEYIQANPEKKKLLEKQWKQELKEKSNG